MDGCLFCGIVAKKIPAAVVHESENVIAFRDVHPGAPTHVLVVPKEHVESIMHLDDRHLQLLGEIHRMIRDVVTKEKLQERGFRVVVNYGPDAGQSVPHLHYHVLAGRKLAWPPG